MNKLFFTLAQGFRIVLIFLATITQVSSQTWQSLGARWSINISKDMAVGYSGSTRILYLAAKEDSLLKSTGSSIYWANMPFAMPDFVACESNNPKTVYTGITDLSSGGIWRSTDEGSTWNQINNGLTNKKVTRLSISPFNNNNLYVGAIAPQTSQPGGGAALYKSTDGGSNWVEVMGGFPSFSITVTRIVFDPSSNQIIYVSCTDFSNGGVWRSSDGGGTWARKISGMTNTDILALAVTPQNTNVLYAGTQGATTRIYKTTNQGETWTAVYSSSNVSINDIKVDPSSQSIVYAATSQGVLKSTNAGATWSFDNTGIGEVDIRAILIDPPQGYIAAFSSFYSRSDVGVAPWVDHSDGAEALSAGGLMVYNDDMYYVTGKSTPILATRKLASSTMWEILSHQTLATQDYFVAKDLAIDPGEPSYLYAAGKYTSPSGGSPQSFGPKIIRSTNGGTTWTVQYQPQPWLADSTHAANVIEVDPI